MQREWPPLSTAFALLQPTTTAALEILRIRHNRHLLVNISSLPEGSEACALDSENPWAFRLDFALMLCRRALSVGSSSANEIKLPSGPDVQPRQFQLRINVTSQRLEFLDMTNGETRVRSLGQHRGPHGLMTAQVVFGHEDRYSFRILSVHNSRPLGQLLSLYADSISAYGTIDHQGVALFSLCGGGEVSSTRRKRADSQAESDDGPRKKLRSEEEDAPGGANHDRQAADSVDIETGIRVPQVRVPLVQPNFLTALLSWVRRQRERR